MSEINCKEDCCYFQKFNVLPIRLSKIDDMSDDALSSKIPILKLLESLNDFEFTLERKWCESTSHSFKSAKLCRLSKLLVISLEIFEDIESEEQESNDEDDDGEGENESETNVRKHFIDVDFPTKDLDISSIIHPEFKSENSNYLYDLYAVVYHSGTFKWGHYTAEVKNTDGDNKWYSWNDHNVSAIRFPSKNKGTPCLLFYHSKQLDQKGD